MQKRLPRSLPSSSSRASWGSAARQRLCYSKAGSQGQGGRGRDRLGARDPLLPHLQNAKCSSLGAVFKRANGALPGREERHRRVTRRAPRPRRTHGSAAALGGPSALGPAGRLAAEGEARSRPSRQAARGARVEFPGRRKPTRNPRGRLTALFGVGPRTCKLSPAHMLHIKPPCPVPFLFFSSERVLINFPSFI